MAEKEYIEREATLHRMKVEVRPPFAVVRDMPSADVVEVRHGKWVYNRDTDNERCTVCGFEWWASCQECGVSPLDTNYCPNCGAKMDGKGDG